MDKQQNAVQEKIEVEPVKPVEEIKAKKSMWGKFKLIMDMSVTWVVLGAIAGAFNPALGVFVRAVGQAVRAAI